ncbi:MAG: ABC transporter ATP-binding protein [Gemmatimonadetes bacterium]|nr:ABC transporter ATP-binding protein [Gemmatimonadota bacterium]MYA64280.1 ABC transporter ATP-binding protein [Gemmatimonadota bacterium]MYB97433.1 ABC transporter ATP-binding protein [Gemmatimonadota bacterium]MYH53208.1 ABC transporter ATP-binding protein [Gemmatimonadota bacterium]MYI45365.1 ABC transporter ATP-binding protein [Gemmatimonadota bacterium]
MTATTLNGGPAELKLIDLDVGYRKGRPVLAGLSLDVVPGEVLAVVGPNGSGKTTLFRTLLGVLAAVGGEASVSGVAPGDYRRRHGVGYLAEDTALPSGWSCDGLLTMAASASGPEADVDRACRLAGVDYDTDVLVDKLSKGMRRRLALAMALMRPTGLLFLDEPESGLDPGQRIRLRRQVEEIRGDMTILVASHDLGELAMMSDRVLLIDDGRGRIVEQPEDGFTREFLEGEFLGLEGAVS